ncbi:fimbrial assembly protein, partial [Cronobacter sakazakii]
MMYTDGDPTDKTKWVVSGAGEVKSNSSRVYSVEAESSSDGTVLPAKVTTWPIKVAAAIQGTDTLAISDDTNLDGSATISLVYI